MGKLLSLLARDDSNCCSSPRYDIFLDFENAAPTETEREVYEEVQRVLLDSDKILEEIQCYKGAGKEIREAIADPSTITQERAWRAVKPLVDKLLGFYNHSLQLQREGKQADGFPDCKKLTPPRDTKDGLHLDYPQ